MIEVERKWAEHAGEFVVKHNAENNEELTHAGDEREIDMLTADTQPQMHSGTTSETGRENALRRLRALRNISSENGAFAAEVEAAAHLAQKIADRFEVAVSDDRSRPERSSAAWDYWQYALNQFGLQASRFGDRVTAAIDQHRRIIICLTTGQWLVQHSSATGYRVVIEQSGIEALRRYLGANTPRLYGLSPRSRTKGGA